MQGFECRVLRATGGFLVRDVIRGGAGIVNDGCEAREGSGRGSGWVVVLDDDAVGQSDLTIPSS